MGAATEQGAEAPAERGRRPRAVFWLGVAALLQGFIVAAAGALSMAAWQVADPVELEDVDLDPTELLVVGIVLVVFGLAQMGFAIGLELGRPGARTVFGVLATVQVGSTVYAMVALRDLRGGGVLSFALGALVLWLLYGSAATQAWFRR